MSAGTARAGEVLSEIDTILFDLDGTLIDSRDLILSSFRHTMEIHLERVPPDSEWLANMGKPLRVQLRGFAESDDEAHAMMATYRAHNAEHHDRLVRPFDGMRETVLWLRERGYRLGIVTSKLMDATLTGLAKCDLPLDIFDGVVTADDPVPHKPQPDPVLLGLERVAERVAERALFIGDSLWDLLAGRAAGTRTAAALWGPFDHETLAPAAPDHYLEKPAELTDAVRS